MIIDRPNPSQVVLQATTHNVDGTPKLALTSATVRVYHLAGGSETQDLVPTALVQVGSTNTWRYIWAPAALSEGQYFAEYSMVDTDGASFVDFEPVVIEDFAQGAMLEDVAVDMAFIKKIEKNRKRILGNQLIIYEDDGVTEWLKWDLFDVNGIPTGGVNVYDTVPV